MPNADKPEGVWIEYVCVLWPCYASARKLRTPPTPMMAPHHLSVREQRGLGVPPPGGTDPNTGRVWYIYLRPSIDLPLRSYVAVTRRGNINI